MAKDSKEMESMSRIKELHGALFELLEDLNRLDTYERVGSWVQVKMQAIFTELKSTLSELSTEDKKMALLGFDGNGYTLLHYAIQYDSMIRVQGFSAVDVLGLETLPEEARRELLFGRPLSETVRGNTRSPLALAKDKDIYYGTNFTIILLKLLPNTPKENAEKISESLLVPKLIRIAADQMDSTRSQLWENVSKEGVDNNKRNSLRDVFQIEYDTFQKTCEMLEHLTPPMDRKNEREEASSNIVEGLKILLVDYKVKEAQSIIKIVKATPTELFKVLQDVLESLLRNHVSYSYVRHVTERSEHGNKAFDSICDFIKDIPDDKLIEILKIKTPDFVQRNGPTIYGKSILQFMDEIRLKDEQPAVYNRLKGLDKLKNVAGVSAAQDQHKGQHNVKLESKEGASSEPKRESQALTYQTQLELGKAKAKTKNQAGTSGKDPHQQKTPPSGSKGRPPV